MLRAATIEVTFSIAYVAGRNHRGHFFNRIGCGCQPLYWFVDVVAFVVAFRELTSLKPRMARVSAVLAPVLTPVDPARGMHFRGDIPLRITPVRHGLANRLSSQSSLAVCSPRDAGGPGKKRAACLRMTLLKLQGAWFPRREQTHPHAC